MKRVVIYATIAVVVILAAAIAVLSQGGGAPAQTVTNSQPGSTQTSYGITGLLYCADYTVHEAAASVQIQNITMLPGDGVCVQLTVDGTTVSDISVEVPRGFMLANSPPLFSLVDNGGADVNYTQNQGTTLSGPTGLEFDFGVLQSGSYLVLTYWGSTLQTLTNVTVT